MAQVKFIKEYTATIIVGGVVGKSKRIFKVGEAYDEVPAAPNERTNGIEIRINPPSTGSRSDLSRQETLVVPAEYLQRVGIVDSAAISKTTKIIIAVAVVAIGYFALKHFKIIK